MKKQKQKRKLDEGQIIKAMKAVFGSTKVHDFRNVGGGVPDCVFSDEYVGTVFCEIKIGKTKTTKMQENWLNNFDGILFRFTVRGGVVSAVCEQGILNIGLYEANRIQDRICDELNSWAVDWC
jgi:hypothetical protein